MGTPPTAPPPPAAAAPAGAAVATELRPLSVGEILDRSIKVYLAQFWTLARIVLVFVIPAQVLGVVVTLSTAPPGGALTPGAQPSPGQPFPGGDAAVYVGGQLVLAAIGLAVLLVTTAACFKAVADGYLGGAPDWRASLRFASRRSLGLLWLWFLMGVILTLAMLLLLIPAVYLGIAWLVATPVLLLEGVGGFKALGRSFRLVRRRWWATFACVLVATVLVTVVTSFSLVIVGATAVVGEDAWVVGVVLGAVANTVGSVISTPFPAALVALVYFDLRVRKEGLDLQLLAERIGAPGPAPGAPAFAAAPPVPGPPAPPPAPPRDDAAEPR